MSSWPAGSALGPDQCGMCGACGSQPPWAPEALSALSADSRAAVLARVEEKRARFVAERDASDRPSAPGSGSESEAQQARFSSTAGQHATPAAQNSLGSDLFLTPIGSPAPEPEPGAVLERDRTLGPGMEVEAGIEDKLEDISRQETMEGPEPDVAAKPELEPGGTPPFRPKPAQDLTLEAEDAATHGRGGDISDLNRLQVTNAEDRFDLIGDQHAAYNHEPVVETRRDDFVSLKELTETDVSPEPLDRTVQDVPYKSPEIVPVGQWPAEGDSVSELEQNPSPNDLNTADFAVLSLDTRHSGPAASRFSSGSGHSQEHEGLEESVSSRRARLSRRNDPDPIMTPDTMPTFQSPGFQTTPESPSQVEVSLRSPQFRVRSISDSFQECECDSLRKRVAELELHVEALEGALEARAMATVALRAKTVKGASPKNNSVARLREECDSMRLTVDFRKYQSFQLPETLII